MILAEQNLKISSVNSFDKQTQTTSPLFKQRGSVEHVSQPAGLECSEIKIDNGSAINEGKFIGFSPILVST